MDRLTREERTMGVAALVTAVAGVGVGGWSVWASAPGWVGLGLGAAAAGALIGMDPRRQRPVGLVICALLCGGSLGLLRAGDWWLALLFGGGAAAWVVIVGRATRSVAGSWLRGGPPGS